jgi:uncharacterized membrane protein
MRWKPEGLFPFTATVLMTVLWLAMGSGSSALAEEEKDDAKDLPERGISVSPEYTGVVVDQGEDVSIDLIVTNRGRRDENIDLTVTSFSKGWHASIKTFSFGVTGVHVRGDTSKNLALKVQPEDHVGPGKYKFGILAVTRDRKLTSSGQVTVTVKARKETKNAKGVNIITSYPVLRGPTDAEFEFSLEIENRLDKDSIFNLTSQGPENWEINFKPAYDEKFISSLRLKANQSQTVAVEVKPYPLAEPGEYPITVKVGSAEAKGEALLTVALTGIYKLDLGTASGLLSLNALRGQEANLSFYVQNTGSAPLNNIQFFSVKPENWKMEFSPEKIDVLAPEKLKQVEVSITPAEQALVGDYSVGLSTEAGRVSKTIELRVTVRASTAWGWIGIGIIALVVIGLVVLFIRLGRR